MAESAKRMGRPPGEPSKVVLLPLPVAAFGEALGAAKVPAKVSLLQPYFATE